MTNQHYLHYIRIIVVVVNITVELFVGVEKGIWRTKSCAPNLSSLMWCNSGKTRLNKKNENILSIILFSSGFCFFFVSVLFIIFILITD